MAHRATPRPLPPTRRSRLRPATTPPSRTPSPTLTPLNPLPSLHHPAHQQRPVLLKAHHTVRRHRHHHVQPRGDRPLLQPERLTHHPLDPVPHHRATAPPTHRKPQPRHRWARPVPPPIHTQRPSLPRAPRRVRRLILPRTAQPLPTTKPKPHAPPPHLIPRTPSPAHHPPPPTGGPSRRACSSTFCRYRSPSITSPMMSPTSFPRASTPTPGRRNAAVVPCPTPT